MVLLPLKGSGRADLPPQLHWCLVYLALRCHRHAIAYYPLANMLRPWLVGHGSFSEILRYPNLQCHRHSHTRIILLWGGIGTRMLAIAFRHSPMANVLWPWLAGHGPFHQMLVLSCTAVPSAREC